MRGSLGVVVLASIATLGAALPAAGELRNVAFGARGSFDLGGAFVSGVESGIGAGAFARLALGDARREWELSGELDVAGYTAQADGDPILQLTGNVIRRGFIGRAGEAARAYWAVGLGAGIVGGAGSGAAFPLQLKLGLRLGAKGAVAIDLALVERLTVIAAEGQPKVSAINGLGLELGLRLGR